MIKMVGYDMAKACAKKVYEQAGLGPKDVQVVELHDCFTANELLTYEALGLCKEGEAEKFIEDGDNTYGGKFVTNPSGGLLSKGHPLGATGLAQCTELVWQLRGTAEQAPGPEREGRAPAQPRPRRRVRRDDVPDGLSETTMSKTATGVIDAWIQHPSPKFIRHPMFASLRRWAGDGDVPDEIPLELTVHALEAAGVKRAMLSAWWGPDGRAHLERRGGRRACARIPIASWAWRRSISCARWTASASCGAP